MVSDVWALSVLLMLAVPMVVRAQTACTDESERTIEQYVQAPVCLVVSDGTTTTRIGAGVSADKFTLLEMKDAANLRQGSAKTIRVRVGAHLSEPTVYFENGNTVPFFTITIVVENGKIIRSTWDNQCFLCEPAACLANFCSVRECEGSACSPKVYISWGGTDSKGTPMTSAALRLSRFRRYSASKLYSNILDTAKAVPV